MRYEYLYIIALPLALIFFLREEILALQKKVVILRSSSGSISAISFAITITISMCTWGFDWITAAFVAPVIVVAAIYISYDYMFNISIRYFNSEIEVIYAILKDVLEQYNIAYSIEGYLEIVLQNTKARLVLNDREVKIKRYKAIPNYEKLIETLRDTIIESGYVPKSKRRRYSKILWMILFSGFVIWFFIFIINSLPK